MVADAQTHQEGARNATRAYRDGLKVHKAGLVWLQAAEQIETIGGLIRDAGGAKKAAGLVVPNITPMTKLAEAAEAAVSERPAVHQVR